MVKVNGNRIYINHSGYANAALILKPGKNLAVISFVKNDGSIISVSRNILRLVRFEDMNALYFGRPHWAKSIILDMSELGITEAYPDSNFMPNEPVTRSEFASWLVRSFSLPSEEAKNNIFSDVSADQWRAGDIKTVTDLDYMAPLTPTTFGINDPILRRKAISIAGRIVSIERSILIDKKDDNASLLLAINKGITIGVSNKAKFYDFDRNMTRAEAAALLSRVDSVKEKISGLSKWDDGFDDSKKCLVAFPPRIIAAAGSPESVSADGTNKVLLSVKLATGETKSDYPMVTVDLQGVGGPSDALMFDDGTHGDEVPADNIYSLSFPVNTDVAAGKKRFVVTAQNKRGLKDSSRISVYIYSPR
jgi:hypothetical protein